MAPSWTLTLTVCAAAVAVVHGVNYATLVSFDGNPATTYSWQVTNDPVVS